MAASIKPIDQRSVHQIQSGQVITDLCSIVKELVENGIDAGATTLDVRFKNQGLDLVEVQDNGSGISPSNHASIALKHHTSKLASISDLASLQTFGFRGEALASLCALSVLSITTCLESHVPKGSRLTFELTGQLKETTVVAAQKGTSVSVEKLFHNLPVRRRELERNIKREWHKVIALLNQYACIQTNLKFSISHQPTKGKRILLFSTKGNPSVRDNIINIFGAKTLGLLMPLDLSLTMHSTESHAPLDALQLPQRKLEPCDSKPSARARLFGYVSRPSSGEARVSPDRQMFFVNGRPCGLSQLTKLFNEVYKLYCQTQSPFILADLQLDTHHYDVNVSPDKRSIFLHDQSLLFDSVRRSLTALLDGQGQVLPVSQLSKGVASRKSTISSPARLGVEIKDVGLTETRLSDDGDDSDSSSAHPEPKSHFAAKKPLPSDQLAISSWLGTRQPSSTGLEDTELPRTRNSTVGEYEKRESPFIGDDNDLANVQAETLHECSEPRAHFKTGHPAERLKASSARSLLAGKDMEGHQEAQIPSIKPLPLKEHRTSRLNSTYLSSKEDVSIMIKHGFEPGSVAARSYFASKPAVRDQRLESLHPNRRSTSPGVSCRSVSTTSAPCSDAESGKEPQSTSRKGQFEKAEATTSAHTGSDSSLRAEAFAASGRIIKSQSCANIVQWLHTREQVIRPTLVHLPSPRATEEATTTIVEQVEDIAAPDAEAMLPLVLMKRDFATMRIVGQFNLGFVLAVRSAKFSSGQGAAYDEVFIIDQHASDEKYNYEKIRTSTKIQTQRLVNPVRLSLTALEEEIVMQHHGAIEANGFSVDIDMTGSVPVGSRCKLLALPLSRETTFDIKDLEELISLLGDMSSGSTHIPCPSKMNKIFAMRACRSSIMIGKALSVNQMRTVVRHMWELDKPWNCPHGRPTMRHLCRLHTLDDRGWRGDASALSPSLWRTYGEKIGLDQYV